MITNELIEDVTKAYLHSYSIALNETRNPNLAVQCATGVTLVVGNMVRQNQQGNPIEVLLAAMSSVAQQTHKKKPNPHPKESEKPDNGEVTQ